MKGMSAGPLKRPAASQLRSRIFMPPHGARQLAAGTNPRLGFATRRMNSGLIPPKFSPHRRGTAERK